MLERRVKNIDDAIAYYAKRLAVAQRKRDKLVQSNGKDIELHNLEVMLLSDFIDYLKIC